MSQNLQEKVKKFGSKKKNLVPKIKNGFGNKSWKFAGKKLKFCPTRWTRAFLFLKENAQDSSKEPTYQIVQSTGGHRSDVIDIGTTCEGQSISLGHQGYEWSSVYYG